MLSIIVSENSRSLRSAASARRRASSRAKLSRAKATSAAVALEQRDLAIVEDTGPAVVDAEHAAETSPARIGKVALARSPRRSSTGRQGAIAGSSSKSLLTCAWPVRNARPDGPRPSGRSST